MANIHRSQPGTSGTTKLNHQTNEAWLPVPQRQLNIAPPLDPAACLHGRCLVFESSVATRKCGDGLKIPIKKIQQDATVCQNLISYLYEAQHVSGDTSPILRSLKLH
jgi:hypothetical protein